MDQACARVAAGGCALGLQPLRRGDPSRGGISRYVARLPACPVRLRAAPSGSLSGGEQEVDRDRAARPSSGFLSIRLRKTESSCSLMRLESTVRRII